MWVAQCVSLELAQCVCVRRLETVPQEFLLGARTAVKPSEMLVGLVFIPMPVDSFKSRSANF